MPQWEFPGTAPVDTFIDIAAGSIAVAAEPTDQTTVELTALGRGNRITDEVRVSFENGRLEVAGPRRSGLWRGSTALQLKVTVPPGSRCVVRTASADVACSGDLAELDVNTASGDVVAAAVTGNVQVVTASGDVRLDGAGADADVRTAGGDIRLASAGGEVRIRTASGDVCVGSAAASVGVQTASGDIRLLSVAAGRTEATTVSGDAVIAVAAGVGVYLDLASLTGSVTSDLDETGRSDDVALEVKCRTVSGDIQIIRAKATGPAQQH